MDQNMNKIIIVTRKTRLMELIYKYNTLEQAQFYIEHLGADFSDYIREDKQYKNAVKHVVECAERCARVQEIDREFVPNMIFGERDVVIVVGQDGLVANVMKYLNGQPLIGVNPDVSRWDGVLLPFEPEQMDVVIPKVVVKRTFSTKKITIAQAVTKDGQYMLGVNDLFIGCKTHASARYDISWNGQKENQSSSGIIVSTGLGSTGWYKSVMNQANRMANLFQCGSIEDKPIGWSDDSLAFVVREAYPSRSTQADMIYGRISAQDEFQIVSKMPANGVVFSDGMEDDAIIFNSGTSVTIGIADKKGCLVV